MRLGLALTLLASSATLADSRIPSHTVDGGGAHSRGARFSVEGTIGQPDAGRLVGDRYTVRGGFWPTTREVAPRPDDLFKNGFED